MTFQDVMTASRKSGNLPTFDRSSGNPYLTWTDPDSTDHVSWYLDGVTAYNEILIGQSLGIAGNAVWRLGWRRPSLWQVLRRTGLEKDAQMLQKIPPGYDVEFDGLGELLRVANRPTNGSRTVVIDPDNARVIDQRITRISTPYIVARWGRDSLSSPGSQQGKKIALTFDDGPDDAWTPNILDTLRSRNAPATFFVIGAHALSHPALLRQIFSEGHEIGNHTYTHPNLGLTSLFVTRLELDATEPSHRGTARQKNDSISSALLW